MSTQKTGQHCVRSWSFVLLSTILCGVLLSASGCAVLAGGAAGAATGYVAGKAAQD